MRRLNVKLALWLVGITVVSVVGVHVLHGFQLERNADFLRVQAETAAASNKVEDAVKNYTQYLKYRDDPVGYEALAKLVVEVAGDADATRQHKWRAYQVLEEAIRRHPDLTSVRRQLVDYTMMMGRFPEAIEHADFLSNSGVHEPELDLKVARCLIANGDEEGALRKLSELLGYDPQTDQFSEQAPAGASEVGAYELLMQLVIRKTEGPRRAEAVMKRLVEQNPDSAPAHLARANFLSAMPTSDSAEKAMKFEEAQAELARAFELAPHDADVLLTAANYAMTQRDFPKAQQLLDEALERYPDRQDVYVKLAFLAIAENDPKLAVERLELGLKKSKEVQAILERLIDLQFQLDRLSDVRETLKLMQDRPFLPEFLRYQEARLKYSERNFLEASRELAAIRPAIERFVRGAHLQQLDVMLGRCYEELAQPDSQLEVYRRLLVAHPDLLLARLGHATALQSLGKLEEAQTDLDVLVSNAELFPQVHPILLQLLFNSELRKPAEQRDWTKVEKIAGLIFADKSRPELDVALIRADLQLYQGNLEAAQKTLTAASKQYPKDVRVWTALARLLRRMEKSSLLPQLLKLAEKEVGDVLPLRMERLRLATMKGGDEALAEVEKFEQSAESLNGTERTSFMMQLGGAYLQLGNYEGVKRCWQYVIKQEPTNMSIRQLMFDLAIDNKDEATMQEVQREIHDSKYLGSQTPLYKYCAATSLIWPLNKKAMSQQPLDQNDKAQISQARKLIADALLVRPEWSVLWRVRGELDQLDGDTEGAIAAYQRALEYNRNGQTAIGRRLVQLLYVNNRISEANEALKFVGRESDLPDVWKRTVEDIVLRSGSVDSAIEMAKRDAEGEPDNAASQMWFGQLLTKAGRTDEAEAAFRKAVEISPEHIQTWDLLIAHLMASKKTAEAVEAVREATKALPDNPFALAQLYERVGEKERAEDLYVQSVKKTPDSLVVLKRVAEFYMLVMRTPDKATSYLDEIFQKTEKSTDKTEIGFRNWARRTKAQNMADQRNYERVVEATKMIEQNAQDGELADDDAMAIVALLVNRPDLESREKAIGLLEKVQRRRGTLSVADQVALGQLYDRVGKWERGRDLILEALSREPNDAANMIILADILLRHDQFDDATRWVERLKDAQERVNALSPVLRQSLVEIQARLLTKNGHADEAATLLESLISRPLAQRQLFRLEEVAKQLESIEQYDAAERLLNEYVTQDPRGTLAMAAFLGRRGQLDKAFSLLGDARKNQSIADILICSMDLLRKFPERFTKDHFKTLEDWTMAALQTESDPLQIKLVLAELYDYQGRYPEVIKIYREIMGSEKANAYQRVVATNNLAYVLAITRQEPAEALKLTEQSIRQAGPTSDLLDTRGLVYLAQGKFEPALTDLQMAVIDAPTPSKYLHLAEASAQAKNLDAARDALAKAQEMGVNPARLSTAERQNYDQLLDQLK